MSSKAVSLPRIDRREVGLGPEHIFLLCHRPKVVRIHARRVVAFVINHKTVRNRSDMMLVRPSVCEFPLLAYRDSTVSICKDLALPFPTSRFETFRLRVEPLYWILDVADFQRISVGFPTAVMLDAESAFSAGCSASVNGAVKRQWSALQCSGFRFDRGEELGGLFEVDEFAELR